jgi:dimeric dUTPase (all-alpha-NTP-PPase superfamily)
MTNDKLDSIFERQRALDGFIITQRNLTGWSISESLQKLCMAIMVETGELASEAGYKWWKNAKPLNMQAIREELVDILHFFVSACNTVGMDASLLYNTYMNKNQENFDRQMGKSAKPGYSLQEKPSTSEG